MTSSLPLLIHRALEPCTGRRACACKQAGEHLCEHSASVKLHEPLAYLASRDLFSPSAMLAHSVLEPCTGCRTCACKQGSAHTAQQLQKHKGTFMHHHLSPVFFLIHRVLEPWTGCRTCACKQRSGRTARSAERLWRMPGAAVQSIASGRLTARSRSGRRALQLLRWDLCC